MCVQDIDVQCVLQFTLIHAAGCALHRHTSRVIHRLEVSLAFSNVFLTSPPCSSEGKTQRGAVVCEDKWRGGSLAGNSLHLPSQLGRTPHRCSPDLSVGNERRVDSPLVSFPAQAGPVLAACASLSFFVIQ